MVHAAIKDWLVVVVVVFIIIIIIVFLSIS